MELSSSSSFGTFFSANCIPFACSKEARLPEKWENQREMEGGAKHVHQAAGILSLVLLLDFNESCLSLNPIIFLQSSSQAASLLSPGVSTLGFGGYLGSSRVESSSVGEEAGSSSSVRHLSLILVIIRLYWTFSVFLHSLDIMNVRLQIVPPILSKY